MRTINGKYIYGRIVSISCSFLARCSHACVTVATVWGEDDDGDEEAVAIGTGLGSTGLPNGRLTC